MAEQAAVLIAAIPVLPAIDVAASLAWWTGLLGFAENFRDATPPNYAGISRDGVTLHISRVTDPAVARATAEQTMTRLSVANLENWLARYLAAGGTLRPSGGIRIQPWGTRELTVIDPAGVCISLFEPVRPQPPAEKRVHPNQSAPALKALRLLPPSHRSISGWPSCD